MFEEGENINSDITYAIDFSAFDPVWGCLQVGFDCVTVPDWLIIELLPGNVNLVSTGWVVSFAGCVNKVGGLNSFTGIRVRVLRNTDYSYTVWAYSIFCKPTG